MLKNINADSFIFHKKSPSLIFPWFFAKFNKLPDFSLIFFKIIKFPDFLWLENVISLFQFLLDFQSEWEPWF